jgi:hypothetical protein
MAKARTLAADIPGIEKTMAVERSIAAAGNFHIRSLMAMLA